MKALVALTPNQHFPHKELLYSNERQSVLRTKSTHPHTAGEKDGGDSGNVTHVRSIHIGPQCPLLETQHRLKNTSHAPIRNTSREMGQSGYVRVAMKKHKISSWSSRPPQSAAPPCGGGTAAAGFGYRLRFNSHRCCFELFSHLLLSCLRAQNSM